ncbi:hypothetical protein UACE39S_00651 [Ureibacillus acetophenoni]
MNDELKFKWHSIYGQILFDRKLLTAWTKVKSNNGAGGIDGETIETFEAKAEERLDNLLTKLRKKEYLPSPVRRVYIPKRDGSRRPLGIRKYCRIELFIQADSERTRTEILEDRNPLQPK